MPATCEYILGGKDIDMTNMVGILKTPSGNTEPCLLKKTSDGRLGKGLLYVYAIMLYLVTSPVTFTYRWIQRFVTFGAKTPTRNVILFLLWTNIIVITIPVANCSVAAKLYTVFDVFHNVSMDLRSICWLITSTVLRRQNLVFTGIGKSWCAFDWTRQLARFTVSLS